MGVVPRYAAIDIGSNSVRMEAAEVTPGQPTRILASDREVTRLGESVFRVGAVSEGAIESTCAVLARMASLYRKLEVAGVRQQVKIMVGGAPVTDSYAREIGADGYSDNAGAAVNLARRLLGAAA